MYTHLILVLLPAFGITALSAPNPVAANGNVSHIHDGRALFKRAPTLCGLEFRSHPDPGPNNQVYIYDSKKKEFRWEAAGSDHTGCDREHTIDLQLVKTAFEESMFCTAFDKMIATAAPHVNLDRVKVLKPLRDIANHPDGVFWCDSKVNGDKSTLVGRVRTDKGEANMDDLKYPDALRDYFAGVKGTGDALADRIDAEANAVLDSIATQATWDLECQLSYYQTTGQRLPNAQQRIEEIEEQIEDITCLLAEGKSSYKPLGGPVKKFWGYFVQVVSANN